MTIGPIRQRNVRGRVAGAQVPHDSDREGWAWQNVEKWAARITIRPKGQEFLFFFIPILFSPHKFII
jgi:hypothetical protein